MIDSQTPGSPGWWFKRLADKQTDRMQEICRLARYAKGDHDLPEGDHKDRDTYRAFQRLARTNFTGLVTESVLERLHITGFRAGSGANAEDDSDAWSMWQANHLDADISLAFRDALSMRESYLMIGPPDGSAGPYPVITVEDPRTMIAEMDPLRQRVPRAALKIWADSTFKERRAVLYLPDSIHYYRAPLNTGDEYRLYEGFQLDSWEEGGSAVNTIGRVPVVRLANRMDSNGSCMAEAEDVLDVQDRINNEILDRLVISKMQAYRQRWVTGAVFEDEEGNPLQPFRPGADSVWHVENPDAKFGDFSQADMTPILAAIRDDVRDMAAITRTPPHYLLGEFTNVGGDGFSISETGLVAKCKERMAHYGEAIEDAIRLGYAYMGDARASSLDSEVVWADPQYRSMAEMADAATKLSAAGVPWRSLMETLGYTPQQIDRMDAERATDALLTSMMQPTTQAAPQGPQTGAEGVPEPEEA